MKPLESVAYSHTAFLLLAHDCCCTLTVVCTALVKRQRWGFVVTSAYQNTTYIIWFNIGTVTLSDCVQSRNYCQSLFNIGTMVQGTFSEAAGELALKSPVQDDRFI